jgi:nucleotide-binding universal stress UspA family protein
MDRILVAVDDSAAGLASARLAVGLAAQLGGSLRLVHVVADSYVASRVWPGPLASRPRRSSSTANRPN